MIHLVLVQYAFKPFRDGAGKENRFKFIADDTSFLCMTTLQCISSASSTSKAKITNICGYAGS